MVREFCGPPDLAPLAGHPAGVHCCVVERLHHGPHSSHTCAHADTSTSDGTSDSDNKMELCSFCREGGQGTCAGDKQEGWGEVLTCAILYDINYLGPPTCIPSCYNVCL